MMEEEGRIIKEEIMEEGDGVNVEGGFMRTATTGSGGGVEQLLELPSSSSGGTSSDGGSATVVMMMEEGGVEVDESPLRPVLKRNKESLKLKLQMRRPINQLVDQGILPSPNTPPAYACQRVKLERARTGDLIKAKIQQRPSRQELVRQHILEETDPRVAPSLAEKQRMLKRARLADSLNDHLIHRPGPLELVKKNILHAPDVEIEKAIKEGMVPFKATSEGTIPGPSLPTKYTNMMEDDSSSDVSSPSGGNVDSVSTSEENSESQPAPSTETTTTEPPIAPVVPEPVVEVQNKQQQQQVVIVTPAPPPPPPPPPYSFAVTSQTQQNVSIFAVPIFGTRQTPVFQASPHSSPQLSTSGSLSSSSSGSSLKSRSKKISKSKSLNKPKTIKFHEYKGPPSAQKGNNGGSTSSSSDDKSQVESSYDLLLQQQQLFLQWQLEWQHRFPKILLPAVSKMSPDEKKAFLQSSVTTTFPSHPPSAPTGTATPVQIISNPGSNSLFILSSHPHAEQSISASIPKINSNNQTSTHTSTTSTPTAVTFVPAQTAQTATLLITTPAPMVTTTVTSATTTVSTKEVQNKQASPPPPSSLSILPSKLSDMKVNELKAELKKRNLPVSGSKSQLIERLQESCAKAKEKQKDSGSGVEQEQNNNNIINNPVSNQNKSQTPVQSSPTQPQEFKFYITGNNTAALLNPQTLQHLQKAGLIKTVNVESKDNRNTAVGGIGSSEGIVARSVLQQKIQQKLLQQQQANKSQSPSLSGKDTSTSLPSENVAKKENELRQSSAIPAQPQRQIQPEVVVEHPKQPEQQQQQEAAWVLTIPETSNTVASFENCLADLLSETTGPSKSSILPHHGNEGFSQAQSDHVKSQMVDDVLEILIRNGELPASAAVLNHAQSQSSLSKPPPAPPLPPTTFAITLPTEIRFRPTSQNSPHPLSRKDSLLGITNLTKDAAEILRIREELATSLFKKEGSSPPSELMELEDNNSNISMSEVMKPSTSSSGSVNKPLINGVGEVPSTSSSTVIDELLTEALEFPMDTDYADWIENFSPAEDTYPNNNPIFHPTPTPLIMEEATTSNTHHISRDPLLSSNSKSTSSTNHHHHHRPFLDNPSFAMEHHQNPLGMDIDSNPSPSSTANPTNPTTTAPSSSETDLMMMKMRKEDNVNVNNLNNCNDLWDLPF